MILNVKNRLLILNFLPKSSGISEQVVSRDIVKKVELDEATRKLIDLKNDESGNISWNSEKEELLDVEFSGAEILLLKECVEELDKQKNVTPQYLDLCLEIKKM